MTCYFRTKTKTGLSIYISHYFSFTTASTIPATSGTSTFGSTSGSLFGGTTSATPATSGTGTGFGFSKPAFGQTAGFGTSQAASTAAPFGTSGVFGSAAGSTAPSTVSVCQHQQPYNSYIYYGRASYHNALGVAITSLPFICVVLLHNLICKQLFR